MAKRSRVPPAGGEPVRAAPPSVPLRYSAPSSATQNSVTSLRRLTEGFPCNDGFQLRGFPADLLRIVSASLVSSCAQ